MRINFKELSKACDGTLNCDCPFVAYDNEDGRCYHRACEGRHEDCGQPIAVIVGEDADALRRMELQD